MTNPTRYDPNGRPKTLNNPFSTLGNALIPFAVPAEPLILQIFVKISFLMDIEPMYLSSKSITILIQKQSLIIYNDQHHTYHGGLILTCLKAIMSYNPPVPYIFGNVLHKSENHSS